MFSMVSMMTTKSTTMVMAVVLVSSRGQSLAKEQLLVVGKQVVQRHLQMSDQHIQNCDDNICHISEIFDKIWKYLTIFDIICQY